MVTSYIDVVQMTSHSSKSTLADIIIILYDYTDTKYGNLDLNLMITILFPHDYKNVIMWVCLQKAIF